MNSHYDSSGGLDRRAGDIVGGMHSGMYDEALRDGHLHQITEALPELPW